jgi:methylenetetrahydrofolate dehydrogenase (NADP+) / methenyltetrahydrofolate cyclohydrolase
MTAVLLEGKTLARKIETGVEEEVARLKQAGVAPCLAVVLVGDDPASSVYVASKERACGRVGIVSRTVRLPAAASQAELCAAIDGLNGDAGVHGILVQLPLPAGLDAEAALCRINPSKDADGLTPENLGKLLLGFPYTVPCTPAGVVALLDDARVAVEGMNVVIVGRSAIVGKPLAALLMQKAPGRNCTVTVCHSATRSVVEHTRLADMVVTALGRPGFLKGNMIRSGCVVVDVGITRLADASAEKGYTIAGDADFASVAEKASYLTPVPGGVGLLTVAMLLANTVKVTRFLACRG